MKKRNGERYFKRLVTLATALVLIASSLAITANKMDEERAEITADVKCVDGNSYASTDSKAVVWDNGMHYNNMLTAQDDSALGIDSEPADDFMFSIDQLVNDVHWIGGYYGGPPNDGDFDWRIIFYNDIGDGTQPGTVIATWLFPNANVNETLIQPRTDGGYYSYTVNLPTTLTFLAGTKYWISIQGVNDTPPQSGWAMHSDQILLHETVFRSAYFGYPNWTDISAVIGVPYDMCFQLTYTEQVWPKHKMHYPQLPDIDGWDVYATGGLHPMYPDILLADDWLCTSTGYVTDIHFWGSWFDDFPGIILAFNISIFSDIPADPPYIPYSRPGVELWQRTFRPGDWWESAFDSPGQGWYEPFSGIVEPLNHYTYYQYDIVNITDPFFQVNNTIYWLAINAVVQQEELPQPLWGWKNSEDHWNDDACWFDPSMGWIDLWEPSPPSKANQFWIEFDAMGMPMYAGGTDYYDDGTSFNGWYYYPYTEWWNIWFFDHPFDPQRYKEIFVTFDWLPTGPDYWIEVAINWATDFWPPGLPPPIPPFDPPEDELLYINREYIPIYEPGLVEFFYTIPYYNPEWVSIDVMGASVVIPQGLMIHECLPQINQSLDLAFVITGEPQVCEPGIDIEKYVWNEDLGDWDDYADIEVCTIAEFLITIHNNGTCCDLTNISVYDFMQDSMEFIDAVPYPEYVELVPGGTEMIWYFPGPLSPCNWINISVFAHVVGPACHVDENYVDVVAYCELAGVDVYDYDSAFVHATEPEWPNHKMHYPQLPDPNGWDVLATYPVVCADDWRCTESGPVTDIHFWGSWLYDYIGEINGFWLSIHEDIPVNQSPSGYSMPGAELWSMYVTDFNWTMKGYSGQGWYDPLMPWWEHPNHAMYFQYDTTNIPEPFYQENGTIYWLNIMADVVGSIYPEPPLWGWKTSLNHWNDDAVWSIFDPPFFWEELYDPMTGLSLDMAFVITGEGPSVLCGDVTNNGVIDVGDVVYLVNYLYRGGPPPIPMDCVGDVTCNGVVDVGDVVYLVNYLYRGGPPPCTDCCNPPWG